MKPTITLAAVGDVCLKTRGARHLFREVEAVLAARDIRFANLETVLSSRGKARRKAVPLHSPEESVAHLVDGGFDVVNVANNHTRDLGLEGFLDTAGTLRRAGIAVAGHSPPGAGAVHASVERRGLELGFLGYSVYDPAWCGSPRGFDERMFADVRAAREHCDALVVSLHWGIEGASLPSPRQIRLGRLLVEAGADVVLGHHPHVVQGVEQYAGGLIAYSLGNFQFPPHGPLTDETFVLSVELGPHEVLGWEIVPVRIRRDGIPIPMVGSEREVLHDRVDRLSRLVVEGEVTGEEWMRRIAKPHLKGNLEAGWVRLRRYGAVEAFRMLDWSLRPFNLRCFTFLPRRPTRSAHGEAARAGARAGARLATLAIREVENPHAYGQWPGLERASPFATPAWLESLRARGRTPIYLHFVRGGETVAALGGLRVDPRTPGLRGLARLQTLFFHTGPVVLGDDRHRIADCVDRLIEYARARHVPALFLGSRDYPVSYLPEHEAFEPEKRQEYILDVRGGREAALARMSRVRLRGVREARRAGLAFGVGRRPELLTTLLTLQESTRQRRLAKGHPDYDCHYLAFSTAETLGGLLENRLARIGYVEGGGDVHAALLYIRHGPRAYAVLAGISPRGYETGAGDLLFLELIEALGEEGVEVLNLSGAPETDEGGIARYKTSLGAVPHTCCGGRVLTPAARCVHKLVGI